MDQVERAINQYNKIASQYAANIAGRANLTHLGEFISHLASNSYILDAGSAGGRDSKIFYDKGFRITGIDLSKNLLAIAKKKYPEINFKQADIRSLPFNKNTFDAIWARAILHHLEKQEMPVCLREFHRALKPKGIIFISTKWGEGKLSGQDALSVGEKREFTLLTEEELDGLLTQAKFEKIHLVKEKDPTRDIYWNIALYRAIK